MPEQIGLPNLSSLLVMLRVRAKAEKMELASLTTNQRGLERWNAFVVKEPIFALMQSFYYPHSIPELATHEIHIWCAALNQPNSCFSKFLQTLSMDELIKAEQFHFDRDRNYFIVRRGILRTILGSYLSVEPNRLQFCYGQRGKPELAKIGNNGTIHFSLSHSNTIALYAFSRNHEVGIDVEEIRELEDLEHIAERFFSKREKKALFGLPEGQRKEAFFRCWTRKEAFIKAIGDGLYYPLDKFDVSLVPGEPARLISIEGDSREASRWTLQDLKPVPAFAAAMAVKEQSCTLRCWQWEH
jgi:4'-phosphopantetheinyl transferase